MVSNLAASSFLPPFLSLQMKRTYTSCGCELQNMCAPASLFTANHASELDVVVCLCRIFSSHLIGALSVVCSYCHSCLLAVFIQGRRDHKKFWSYRYSACTRAPGKEAGLGWAGFGSSRSFFIFVVISLIGNEVPEQATVLFTGTQGVTALLEPSFIFPCSFGSSISSYLYLLDSAVVAIVLRPMTLKGPWKANSSSINMQEGAR